MDGMKKVIVRSGKTVFGVTYLEPTAMSYSDNFADHLVANGIADFAELTEDLKTYPTSTIERLIGRWQNVQKMCGPDSRDGREASIALQPLFAEMARRQKANGGEPDARKWK